MAVWLVRAGRSGERELLALEKGVAVIGWDALPDLTPVKSKTELEDLVRKNYPDVKPNTIPNWVGQVWAFREKIHEGDLIVLPLKGRAAIALGRVTGPYRYNTEMPEGAKHTRPVEWIGTDIPRSAFDQDLLYSLGAFMTVCQITRNNAEERIRAILTGTPLKKSVDVEAPEDALTDVEQYALDQIQDYIGRKFRGHDLTRLLEAILRAQGYHTQRSPAGVDGGVDVIAGRGAMGFDPPRLCVQVKSSDSPVDVTVLRELQGVMKNFGANQGLLVAWGGFKNSVISEARRLFFDIRLWDAGNLVKVLLENYERLPEDIQAEFPLKRVWALVPPEE